MFLGYIYVWIRFSRSVLSRAFGWQQCVCNFRQGSAFAAVGCRPLYHLCIGIVPAQAVSFGPQAPPSLA